MIFDNLHILTYMYNFFSLCLTRGCLFVVFNVYRFFEANIGVIMKIAVEGCCHGELDRIYDTLEYIERQDGIKVDLLLICGDFQVTL